LNCAEFTSRACAVSTYASSSGVSPSWCSPAMTRTIGRPSFVAKAKSRSSWPGTAMIAPVP
jgi:hypothetical protein